MSFFQTIYVDSARPSTNVPTSLPSPQRDEMTFFDMLSAYGRHISLHSQQRVLLPDPEQMVVLRDGLLAVDAAPARGKLQVLDFLVAGDVVTAPIIRRAPGVSVRAITNARIVSFDPRMIFDHRIIESDLCAQDYWAFLFARCQRQLARTNVHQLMIGRLETEPRVASFILARASSYRPRHASSMNVSLPMSRADIANYLVINCDTLSRTMMRFETLGLIKRMSRHDIRVLDLDGLQKKSPLAHLVSAVF